MKLTYIVVFEKGPNNFSAYVPDLPGCISTGRDWEEMQWMIKEAIEGHIEVMHEYGDPVPPPQVSVEDALAYHRAQLNDYGGYVPAPDAPEPEEDPYAVLEVEVNLDPHRDGRLMLASIIFATVPDLISPTGSNRLRQAIEGLT